MAFDGLVKVGDAWVISFGGVALIAYLHNGSIVRNDERRRGFHPGGVRHLPAAFPRRSCCSELA